MKTVHLDRSPLGSLGFSIVGGDSSQSDTVPVFVKSVVRHGPAGRDGRIKYVTRHFVFMPILVGNRHEFETEDKSSELDI